MGVCNAWVVQLPKAHLQLQLIHFGTTQETELSPLLCLCELGLPVFLFCPFPRPQWNATRRIAVFHRRFCLGCVPPQVILRTNTQQTTDNCKELKQMQSLPAAWWNAELLSQTKRYRYIDTDIDTETWILLHSYPKSRTWATAWSIFGFYCKQLSSRSGNLKVWQNPIRFHLP